MTVLRLELPDAVLAKLRDLAAQQNVSVDVFATTALVERAEAASQLERLTERAGRGSRDQFLRAMSKVPSVSPLSPDEPPLR